MKSKHLDNAVDQSGEALGIVVDLLAPGLREKLTSKLTSKRAEPETIEPRASDVVVEASAPDACTMCEGAGELQNFRGRFVTCVTCGGKGKRP